jgi:hypothetical protein
MKYLALLAIAVSAPASAEVVSASSNGFEVRETVPLVVPPDVAWSSFASISQWWDPDHTYSGKSENLTLSLQPGGCLCERFPKGGGVEHLRVTYVEPGKHAVLTGALGPLLYEGTVGVMDVQVKQVAGGAQLTLDYKVAGFANGGADKLAPDVDGMLAAQMTRLRAYAARRPRT